MKFCLSHLLQNCVQVQQITALLWVFLNLGPSMRVNSFQQCLVRCGRFLAGLFTFLSRQLILNWLRASGRNWFRKHHDYGRRRKEDFFELCSVTLFWATNCGQSCMQMNGVNWSRGQKLMLTGNYHWPHSMSPTSDSDIISVGSLILWWW